MCLIIISMGGNHKSKNKITIIQYDPVTVWFAANFDCSILKYNKLA